MKWDYVSYTIFFLRFLHNIVNSKTPEHIKSRLSLVEEIIAFWRDYPKNNCHLAEMRVIAVIKINRLLLFGFFSCCMCYFSSHYLIKYRKWQQSFIGQDLTLCHSPLMLHIIYSHALLTIAWQIMPSPCLNW